MPKSKNKRKNGEVAPKKPAPPPIRVSARAHAKKNEEISHAIIQDLQMLAMGVDQRFNEQGKEVHQVRVILGAVIDVLDLREKVEAKIKADREAAQQQAADNAKAGLERLIEQGVAVPATEIALGSLIVGRETDKDGNVIHPGRIQLQVSDQMNDSIRTQLVGKGVGATVKPNDEKTLEVVEIYSINAERIAEIQAEQQKKAEEAAKAAQEQAASAAPPPPAESVEQPQA